MSWSSGKDSAFALHTTRQAPEVDVVGLLTTVNAAAERVAMHAVRRVLLEAQADRLGLPLRVVEIRSPCPNDVYDVQMTAAIEEATAAGVTYMIFGDHCFGHGGLDPSDGDGGPTNVFPDSDRRRLPPGRWTPIWSLGRVSTPSVYGRGRFSR